MQDDGKYASRFSIKPSGGLCAVLPQYHGDNMNEKLKLIRQPLKTDNKSRSFINSFLILLLGTGLGFFAKWLDALSIDSTIWWHRIIGKLDLGNVLSEFPIWLGLTLAISVFSYTPLKSAINSFLFLGGMCVAYHIYTVVICGFDPSDYMKIWYGITIVSPLLAVICWYGKGTHPVSVVIDTLIIAFIFPLCFSIGMVYFSFNGFINAVIFACVVFILYRAPKQITIAVLAGTALAFPLSKYIYIFIPS